MNLGLSARFRIFALLGPLACVVATLTPRPLQAQLDGDRIVTSDAKAHPVPAIQDHETAAERDRRLQWFREARFGMFIHWGLYSIPAGRWQGKEVKGIGEWIMNTASIPVKEYQALAPQFNPVGFDAKQIVALAKNAGMRYIVVTAKHHDGFAMFESKADPFNIVTGTPFHRDPLRELAEECRRQGIKLGFYYSQNQDWTAPGAAALKTGDHLPPTYHWDKAQDGDFDHYLKTKALPQVKELLENYGDAPAILWFDTPDANMTPARAAEFVTLLNQHPQLIWNNRLGGGYKGDTDTPEQYVPPQGFPGDDWETCMTMNDTWGFKRDDVNFKSPETLLRQLIDSASKGGNYLLNIGPDSNGTVPAAEVERLRAIGRWLSVNGEAIYGTQATLFGAEAGALDPSQTDSKGKPVFVSSWKWRSTTRPDRIFIHLFAWPTGAAPVFHLASVPRRVTGAYLLADAHRRPLRVTKAGDGLDITLPGEALDPIATVLVLRTATP